MKLYYLLLLLLFACNNQDSATVSPDSTDGTEVNDTVPFVHGTPPRVQVLDSLGRDTLSNQQK